MKTLSQTYLAAKIAVLDKLMSGAPQHPSDFFNAWSSARTALSVAFPSYTPDEAQQSLRACFPQLNTRWHA